MKFALLAILLFPLSLLAAPSQPASSDVAAFAVDAEPAADDPHYDVDSHFKDFHVGQADFAKILDTYVRVTGEQWTHRYSHVAGGDRTGTATLKDGTILKWFVRPGGLATLTYPDGTIIYLAVEKPSW